MPPPVAGALAGVIVGAAIVAALAAKDFSPTRAEEPHAQVTAAGAADAFVAAWGRKVTGAWAVRATFTRTIPGRQPLIGEIHEAQRPPDRLRRGLGTLEARLGGRRVACAQAGDGAPQCRDAGDAVPYAEEVAAELDLLRGHVAGAGRLYDVVVDERRCFRLRLRVRMLAPPYGEDARFCFDGRTGALATAEVRRGDALDETRATEIRPAPTDADLTP